MKIKKNVSSLLYYCLPSETSVISVDFEFRESKFGNWKPGKTLFHIFEKKISNKKYTNGACL